MTCMHIDWFLIAQADNHQLKGHEVSSRIGIYCRMVEDLGGGITWYSRDLGILYIRLDHWRIGGAEMVSASPPHTQPLKSLVFFSSFSFIVRSRLLTL